MDFKPDCRSCLYISMVLQRPVACERHATAAAWPAAAEIRVEQLPDRLPTLGDRGIDKMDEDNTMRHWPPAIPPGLFSSDEYCRLRALRERVRQHLQRGRHPDHLDGLADVPSEIDGPPT